MRTINTMTSTSPTSLIPLLASCCAGITLTPILYLTLFHASHLTTALYWTTLQNKPKVLTAKRLDETTWTKFCRLLIPYIPVFLPILLFCCHTELKLKLWAFRDLGDTSKLEMWNSLIEEKLLVRNTANDIKIMGEKIIKRTE